MKISIFDPDPNKPTIRAIRESKTIFLGSRIPIEFDEARDLLLHKVQLDRVIRTRCTWYPTGLDMQSRYKETSLAGLAVDAIKC